MLLFLSLGHNAFSENYIFTIKTFDSSKRNANFHDFYKGKSSFFMSKFFDLISFTKIGKDFNGNKRRKLSKFRNNFSLNRSHDMHKNHLIYSQKFKN